MRKYKLLTVLTVLGLTWTGVAGAQDKPLEEQLVDALTKVFGAYLGFRSNHAKGIVVEGSFKASPGAADLSRAVMFSGTEIPATIRFSDATGIPTIPDGSGDANPHGMAIKFHLPDGTDTDMVMISLKFFPVATAEDFRDLLLAVVASPPDAPKPTKLEQFVANHPSVPAATATASTPDSFATEEYHGINAFLFVNKAGAKQAVRYEMMPERTVHLSAADAAQKPPNFLVDEIQERLKRGPVTFRLRAQLAVAGDSTKDPTKAWPSDRKVVDLGVFTIDKVASNSADAEKKLLYMPSQLTDGIEESDDPMIGVRSGAYAVSFSRRNP
jgi:catalase